jgi:hypothetical protein
MKVLVCIASPLNPLSASTSVIGLAMQICFSSRDDRGRMQSFWRGFNSLRGI